MGSSDSSVSSLRHEKKKTTNTPAVDQQLSSPGTTDTSLGLPGSITLPTGKFDHFDSPNLSAATAAPPSSTLTPISVPRRLALMDASPFVVSGSTGVRQEESGSRMTLMMTNDSCTQHEAASPHRPSAVQRDPLEDNTGADTSTGTVLATQSMNTRPSPILEASSATSEATEGEGACVCNKCKFCRQPWKLEYCSIGPSDRNCNICRAIYALLYGAQHGHNPVVQQLQSDHFTAIKTISLLKTRHQEEIAKMNELIRRMRADISATPQTLQQLQEKHVVRTGEGEDGDNNLDTRHAQEEEKLSKLKNGYAQFSEQADHLLAQERNENARLQQKIQDIEAERKKTEEDFSKCREDAVWYIGVLNRRKEEEIANMVHEHQRAIANHIKEFPKNADTATKENEPDSHQGDENLDAIKIVPQSPKHRTKTDIKGKLGMRGEQIGKEMNEFDCEYAKTFEGTKPQQDAWETDAKDCKGKVLENTKIVAESLEKYSDKTDTEAKLDIVREQFEKKLKELEHERTELRRERSEVENLRSMVANMQHPGYSVTVNKVGNRKGKRTAA
jgi:hypothetical protein